MIAPGAEEFVPQAYGSLSLPPQRTFSSLVAGAAFEAQETRHLGVALEQDIATFRVALHALPPGGGRSAGHRLRPEPGRGPAARRPEPLRGRQRRRASAPAAGASSVSRPVGTHVRGRPRVPDVGRRWAIPVTPTRWGAVAPSAVRGRARADARRHDPGGRRRPATATRLLGGLPLQLALHARHSRRARSRARTPATTSRSTRACRTWTRSAQVELVFGVGNLLRARRLGRRSTTRCSSCGPRRASSAASRSSSDLAARRPQGAPRAAVIPRAIPFSGPRTRPPATRRRRRVSSGGVQVLLDPSV